MEWLLEHLSSLTPESVYATLAGILLLCGLGVPIPEDISLITAGYVAHLGVINVHNALGVCLIAVLAGDTMAFFLGRYFGARALESRAFKRIFTPRKQLRVRAYFRKYGSKVIFIGRFLPGLRFSIFFSAGTLKVRPAVFLVYDTFAAIVSVPALVYLAWIFGDHIDAVIAWARRSGYGILLVVTVAAALIVVRAMRKQRRKPIDGPQPAEPPPAIPSARVDGS